MLFETRTGDSALPRWAAVALLALSMLSQTGVCDADTFFQKCAAAWQQQSFVQLKDYLTKNGGRVAADSDDQADYCARLNNHEFMVLPPPSGGDVGRIYHCDFRTTKSCRPIFGNFPSVEVWGEFSDRRGKHFAVLKTDSMRGGLDSEAYVVFFLTDPKKNADHASFVLQVLDGASNMGLASEASNDLCQTTLPIDYSAGAPLGSANKIEHLNINFDKRGRGRLSFVETEEDCDSRRYRTYTQDYVFQNGAFTKIAGEKPPIHRNKLLAPQSLAVDDQGTLYVGAGHDATLLKISAAGKMQVLNKRAAALSGQSHTSIDAVVVTRHHGIDMLVSGDLRVLNDRGMDQDVQTERAKLHKYGRYMTAMAGDAKDDLYIVFDRSKLVMLSPQGEVRELFDANRAVAPGRAAASARVTISGLAVGPDNSVYITDALHAAIDRIGSDGHLRAVLLGQAKVRSWNGQPVKNFSPENLAITGDGRMYVSSGQSIYKVSAQGGGQWLAGQCSGFRDGPGSVARFGYISALVVDPAGDLDVLDAGNEAVRKMTSTGVVSSVVKRFSKLTTYDQGFCTP